MPTYTKWNKAIFKYIVENAEAGSRVFLSIDATALQIIGYTIEKEVPDIGWKEDFIEAVRTRIVHRGDLDLSYITLGGFRDNSNTPRYIGFLALMVLAAHDMGGEIDDEVIDPKDFYKHFNNLLKLETEGRPTYLKRNNTDQEFWEDWNNWLRDEGFRPTAEKGEAAYKFIKYPISQTLLRQSDKKKLWHFFSGNDWKKNYDEVLVMQKLRRSAKYLNRHLRDDIFNSESDIYIRLYDEISAACYEVYEEWREADGKLLSHGYLSPQIRTSLDAHIYRTEDLITEEIEYFVFPRQTKQSLNTDLKIEFEGEDYHLEQESRGWYEPLWQIKESHLNEGFSVDITSATNSPIRKLFFPKRDFWVLSLNPDIPETGIYASWNKSVEVGSEFILLARNTITNDIQKLKEAGLLDWQNSIDIFADWTEYHGAIVLAEPSSWSNISIENEALRLTIEPKESFSIRLIDGVRAPRGMGWFEKYPPQITLSAVFPNADLKILDTNNNIVHTDHINSEKPIQIPNLDSGNYRIIIQQGGQYAEKVLNIIDWDNLQVRLLNFKQIAEDELKTNIYGALVGEY